MGTASYIQAITLLLDGYESFGWEVNDSQPESSIRGKLGSSGRTVIQLKRDRKILNKAELTRLQRNFEACVSEIQTLEQRKTLSAAAYAMILGVIGSAFMAGSTSAVTAQPPRYILCILLAIPDFWAGYYRISDGSHLCNTGRLW